MATMGPIPNSGSRPCASLRPRGKRFSLAVGTVLAVVLISSPSSAETSPRGELEDFFGGVTAILSVAISANQAQGDLRNLARALFDGREAARRALGPAWDGRTGAEREEFIRIFTGVVEHAFLEIVQSRLPGDVMNRSGKGWLVRDVVIDGVSLVGNFRAQFARILRTSSFADLVLRLRTAAGAGTTGPIAAPPNFKVIVAYFDTSSADLSPAARRDLDRAVAWLATNGHGRALVEGYSDQRGDVRPNQALAERRANSIRDYLVTQGIGGDRITIITYAGQRPVCQEPLEGCWVQNRRAVVRMTR